MKKLCIREQIECVNAYELFTKQGNAVKSLFDNTDSSGVHISVEGCTKIRDEIVTFFDSDNVIGAELNKQRAFVYTKFCRETKQTNLNCIATSVVISYLYCFIMIVFMLPFCINYRICVYLNIPRDCIVLICNNMMLWYIVKNTVLLPVVNK